MRDPKKPTVLSFDVDGLCDPETGVCAWPPAAAYAAEESESSDAGESKSADDA